VTFPDGTRRDNLQKIYPVGTMMAAGFAGSVQAGFAMIEDMTRAFSDIPKGHGWWPRIAAWQWHRRGRLIFRNFPRHVQDLGCSLLLVGVAPVDTPPLRKSYCIRMLSPSFTPEFGTGWGWLGIGSGTTHEIAERYVRLTFKDFGEVYGNAEVMNPGGTASMVAFSMAGYLRRVPHSGVSERLLVGEVWPHQFRIREPHSRNMSDPADPPIPSERLPLATSWFEFVESSQGLESASASC
jgi:hypothetical protein